MQLLGPRMLTISVYGPDGKRKAVEISDNATVGEAKEALHANFFPDIPPFQMCLYVYTRANNTLHGKNLTLHPLDSFFKGDPDLRTPLHLETHRELRDYGVRSGHEFYLTQGEPRRVSPTDPDYDRDPLSSALSACRAAAERERRGQQTDAERKARVAQAPLLRLKNAPFRITVADLMGRKWQLDVFPKMAVSHARALLERADTPMPWVGGRLIYNKENMEGERDLASYGVADGELLHILPGPLRDERAPSPAARPAPVAVARAPSPAAAAGGAAWTCGACTLRNAAGVATCGVCGGPRGGVQPPAPLPGGKWACAACSLENSPGALACTLCKMARGAPPPRRPASPPAPPRGGGGGGGTGALAELERLRAENAALRAVCWVCPACSRANAADARSCGGCGKVNAKRF